jgi:hypothetical protein
MPDVPAVNHPLAGTEQVYLPPGTAADPDANTPAPDDGLIARPGDQVLVKEVYENWNGCPGLTMAYVYVPSTGHHTHLSAREMGLSGYGSQDPGHPKPAASEPRGRAGGSRVAAGGSAPRRAVRRAG